MTDKGHVLIVDDDESLGLTLSFVLEDAGYQVTVAGDGPSAIEHVRQAMPDVVLMDIRMPAMNGLDIYRAIKNFQPGVAVILMTAYAVEDVIRDALQEGVVDVVYKPLNIERVLALIAQAVNGGLILIADDDRDFLSSLALILRDKGYGVQEVGDGEQAVQMASSRRQDIILLDMKLPPLDGLITYLDIRRVNPRARVVLMTGYRDEMATLIQQALDNKAFACLYKPFDTRQVLDLLEHLTAH